MNEERVKIDDRQDPKVAVVDAVAAVVVVGDDLRGRKGRKGRKEKKRGSKQE